MKENLINVQMSEEFYNEKFLKMGEGGSGGTMEYLDIRDWYKTDILKKALISTAQLFRIVANGNVAVSTDDSGYIDYCEAVGVDFSLEIISQGQLMTLRDGWVQSLTEEELAAIPRITKEQFYDLSSEEDSGGVKEGDVLYYSCPSTDSSSDTLKDLIKIKDNIVTVAAARAENPNTGSFTPIKSFVNGEDLQWYESTKYGYVSVSTSNYSSLDIIGFSFRVGADLKTALDIVGTPIGGEITQITQEEYENIFNS